MQLVCCRYLNISGCGLSAVVIENIQNALHNNQHLQENGCTLESGWNAAVSKSTFATVIIIQPLQTSVVNWQPSSLVAACNHVMCEVLIIVSLALGEYSVCMGGIASSLFVCVLKPISQPVMDC